MRLVVARCSVDYSGRLSSHLPSAIRLLMVKADGCVAIHADGGAYKPLNWMNAPNHLVESDDKWVVTNTKGETLTINIEEVLADGSHELGEDPGLFKDGVEKNLQKVLAERPWAIEDGLEMLEREYMTDLGPVDLLCRDGDGQVVAVEIKRKGEIAGVEQLARYLEFLNDHSAGKDPRRGSGHRLCGGRLRPPAGNRRDGPSPLRPLIQGVLSTPTLPGEIEPGSNVGERSRAGAIEAISEHHDFALAFIEHAHCLLQVTSRRCLCCDLEWVQGIRVFHEITELGIPLESDGAVERHGVAGRGQRQLHTFQVEPAGVGDLFERRAAAELFAQGDRGLLDGANNIDHVDGEANRPALIAQAAGDRLSNPPGCIGGELEALAPVELLHGPDEAQVALLYEVEKIEAVARVALCYRNDETEVGADELGFGLVCLVNRPEDLGPLGRSELGTVVDLSLCLAPKFHGSGKTDFVLGREQLMCSDRIEVEADAVGQRGSVSQSLYQPRTPFLPG